MPEMEIADRGERMRVSILDAYRRSAETRTLPRVGNLRDREGNDIERHVGTRGSIEMIPVPEDGKVLDVATDSGVMVDGDAELMTKEVTGCLAAFLLEQYAEGRRRCGLVHLTPSSALPWGNYSREDDDGKWGHVNREQTVEKIVDGMERAGVRRESTFVVLIGNRGSDPKAYYSGYSEPEQKKKREDLAELMRAQGFSVTIAEPLEGPTSTVYWNPEHPESITAFTGGEKGKEVSVVSIAVPVNQEVSVQKES